MKRYWSEICAALFLAVVISCFGGVIVYASSAEQQITDQMELTDLQSMVDEMLGEKTFSVAEAFHRLLSGEEVLSEESVREFLHSLLFYGIEREKELIVKLLLLLLFAAVFSGFAGAFDNGQVGEISFYVVYLLWISLLSLLLPLSLFLPDAIRNCFYDSISYCNGDPVTFFYLTDLCHRMSA